MAVARVLLVAARTADNHQKKPKHQGRMDGPIRVTVTNGYFMSTTEATRGYPKKYLGKK